MKTTKFSFSIAVLVLSMAVAITSCRKKDNPAPEDSDTSGASDNSLAERTADDVTNMAAEASEDGGLSSYKYGDDNIFTACATVVKDTTLKTITVTFNGTQCLDGHTRSGVITFDYSGSTNGAKYYRNPGFKCVVSSSSYVVDGNAVSISKTIMNTTAVGFNPATTNLTWSVNSSVSIVKSNGTLSWTSTKNKTLLNTSDTNVYHGQAIHISWHLARVGITGNASGTSANGDSFTANVTSQLVRDFTCSPNSAHPGHHPFIDGKMDFTPGSKATRYFDFGYPNGGQCDDLATVTINGKPHVITLP